ncbi:MAG: hypothetical protein IJV14_06600 [Lachnospiraceae bacterium]|nr:hypothetical protein [Lachnospiraceae bacterium]
MPEHRRAELIHYCRQYDDWKKELRRLQEDRAGTRAVDYKRTRGSGANNPTEAAAFAINRIRRRIEMVDEAARETDPDLAKYIIMSVAKRVTFQTLRSKHDIPVSKNTFTRLRHEFFWRLDKKKE